ncbi:DNA mismatch repair protein MutL [Bdellovibrio sp. qaytius]|nr:DNA mismatch repair protein MutL [Bdellovibrio sp. qaytius]
MSSIQVLSPDVVNQIAAGEVVERPSHLVKELLENSLDANSTQIQIDVNFGGKFIKITDNGDGIDKDDLPLALQRHATSKITETNDLWKLSTYGFRGEALASVAAVSKLTLMSKTKKSKSGFQIKSDFGLISEVMPSSIDQGTQLTVDALFENVPARLKFLKSDSAELAQIRNVIRALSLAYPHVEFKLIENGKLDLFFKAQPNANDISVRASQVLGLDRIYVQENRYKSYIVKAYFSSPHDVQKTSKNIWIFAQKRWIQDRGLQAAITEAYRSLLMHGEYPQVVIDLECAPDLIDVNIHPTKSQVKFQEASEAFRAVHGAVRQGLELAPWIPKVAGQPAQTSQSAASQESHNYNFVREFTPRMEVQDQTRFTDLGSSLGNTQFKTKLNMLEQISQLRVDSTRVIESTSTGGFWSSLQVLGQLNLTYLVCQKNDRMILVDQHAAHERVAFEKLMRKWKGGHIDQQDYLFPLAIDMSPEKAEAILAKSEDIAKMGIEIESLGPSVVGVKSAPLFVKEAALPKIFDKMATDLVDYGGSYSLEKSISDLFATMACHSVVRAGQSLSQSEMVELLKSMDEFPLSSFCPHGRPVSVEFMFNDIEKQFGRTL